MPEGVSDNVRRTRLVYDKLCELRDAQIDERARKHAEGQPESASGAHPPVAMRLRHTRDKRGRPTIDLGKADPDCAHCGGTGRRPDQHVRDPETDEEIVLPVVCRCVKAGGGVQSDLLDKLAAKAAKMQRWETRRTERRRLKNKTRRKHRRR